jgi:hypothetical protein
MITVRIIRDYRAADRYIPRSREFGQEVMHGRTKADCDALLSNSRENGRKIQSGRNVPDSTFNISSRFNPDFEDEAGRYTKQYNGRRRAAGQEIMVMGARQNRQIDESNDEGRRFEI